MAQGFCTRCGLTLEKADSFCPRCGTARYRGASDASAGADSAPENPSAPRNFGIAPTGSKPAAPLVALGILAAIVVLAAARFFAAGSFRYNIGDVLGTGGSDGAAKAQIQTGFQFAPLEVSQANCPQGAVVSSSLITVHCQQNDSSVNQFQFGNLLHIVSGTGVFSEISPATKSILAAPNSPLFGTVALQAHNGFPPDAVAPLIWTPSWGPHQTSWRLVQGWIPVGNSSYVASINTNAPQTSGVYFIAFAFDGELSGDQVAAATNWPRREDTWDDCNDVAQLTPFQIVQAQKCGFTVNQRLFVDGYKPSYLPADAIIVHVEGVESRVPLPLAPAPNGIPEQAAQPGLYGSTNSANQDRNAELQANCGPFTRVYAAGGTFAQLCDQLHMKCAYVCDWEGRMQPCGSNAHDGSRVVSCQPMGANNGIGMPPALIPRWSAVQPIQDDSDY